ncbi:MULTISPECIES: 4-hydroxythreonine-4-phosphate dehydrogenase PdxA [unclassified Caballeronia]|uniref:4-hydroxythreonine-4-phosphate dehydrogenase PdxA n=1 Tax=unclassified Caballeronia TaxID=2646786 RepID=UPI00385745FD
MRGSRRDPPPWSTSASYGYGAQGPLPGDTVFLRARDQKVSDGVITMYHDQRGWASCAKCVHGRLPVPIATPAPGTAYEIDGEAGRMSARHTGVRDSAAHGSGPP